MYDSAWPAVLYSQHELHCACNFTIRAQMWVIDGAGQFRVMHAVRWRPYYRPIKNCLPSISQWYFRPQIHPRLLPAEKAPNGSGAARRLQASLAPDECGAARQLQASCSSARLKAVLPERGPYIVYSVCSSLK
jgi:hypothetical protein